MMNPTRHAARFVGGTEQAHVFLYVHDEGGEPPPKFEVLPFTFPGTLSPGVYFYVGELDGEVLYVRESTNPDLEVDRLELYG